MFTPESTLEEDQKTFVYFFLWMLHESVSDKPVDKERVSHAFGYAVSVADVFKVDLEFRICTDDIFPVFESMIDEALTQEPPLLKNIQGEDSFIFTEFADEGFKKFYPASIKGEMRTMLSLASKLAGIAYENRVHFINQCRRMLIHERRNFDRETAHAQEILVSPQNS